MEKEIILKAIEYAPDWLKEDIEKIRAKNHRPRPTTVVIALCNKYDFSLTEILTAQYSSEWSVLAKERLNFIDNNIDLILEMLKE